VGVAYVLDGSARKSGAQVRGSRLVRADTGYVVWSENYNRPWHYTVMVQDEISKASTRAGESLTGKVEFALRRLGSIQVDKITAEEADASKQPRSRPVSVIVEPDALEQLDRIPAEVASQSASSRALAEP